MSFVESPAAPRAPEIHVLATAPEARPGSGLKLHPLDGERRVDVEGFIADVYRRHFSARLTHFMPMLVSLGSGATSAAAGYRSGAFPLFLERYLPRPVEQMLGDALGRQVVRRHIVEVGQFASRTAGAGRRLMPELARHLIDSGFRWAAITATAELRRLLKHRGLSVLSLGAAHRHCVGAEAPLWGSYYRHAPKVLAGDLLLNLQLLQRGRR